MSVEIRPATAYLVVGDDLPPRISDAVKHFEIVVCTSRSTVQQQQGRFPCCFAHDSVVGLVTHERHIAISDFIMHNERIRMCEIHRISLIDAANIAIIFPISKCKKKKSTISIQLFGDVNTILYLCTPSIAPIVVSLKLCVENALGRKPSRSSIRISVWEFARPYARALARKQARALVRSWAQALAQTLERALVRM